MYYTTSQHRDLEMNLHSRENPISYSKYIINCDVTEVDDFKMQ